jgi:catalase (peroxidase I)
MPLTVIRNAGIAQKTKTGGSNGATMRFAPESTDGANAGLNFARDFLEPVKKANPWITYADLWTLVRGPPTARTFMLASHWV